MRADDSDSVISPSVADTLSTKLSGRSPTLVSTDDGSVAFIRQGFPESAGVMGQTTQLRLALVVGGGGRLEQHCPLGQCLDANWSVGQFNVVIPGQLGTYRSPAVEVLGIAIDGSSLERHRVDARRLSPLTGALHRDATISALLHAMSSTSETGLLSDKLLWACAMSILQRLVCLSTAPPGTATRPLSMDQLGSLMLFINASRDVRPSVKTMAGVLAMDETRFRRAIHAATGMAPYEFLTHHRMHWARAELSRGARVTEVAQSVGYANPSKFSAAFRRVIGKSPTEARRG